MFGFVTIIAFVIAWKAGGWWWLFAILIGLGWIGSKGQKDANKNENPVDVPLDRNTSTPPPYDAQERIKTLHGTDDQIAMLIEICARYSGPNYYIAELIPPKKLLTANGAYPVPDRGQILALIDATAFGSATNGMAIGEHGISWHSDQTPGSKKSRMWWIEFVDVSIEKSGLFDVEIGEGNKFNTSGCGFGRDNIIKLLREIQAAIRNANQAMQQPNEARSPPPVIDFVNVNTANSDLLISLPCLGAAEAMMIIERRASGTFFHSLDELSEFLHLKPHKVEQLRSRVVFSMSDLPLATNVSNPPTEPALGSSPSPSTGRVID